MKSLDKIKDLISEGASEEAIKELNSLIEDSTFEPKDEVYYLRGNAYRKHGDWQQALNNYQLAIDLNPDSPAATARQMVVDILNFYDTRVYNQ